MFRGKTLNFVHINTNVTHHLPAHATWTTCVHRLVKKSFIRIMDLYIGITMGQCIQHGRCVPPKNAPGNLVSHSPILEPWEDSIQKKQNKVKELHFCGSGWNRTSDFITPDFPLSPKFIKRNVFLHYNLQVTLINKNNVLLPLVNIQNTECEYACITQNV